ncbi:hypothetical protein JKA74_01055 [Marivirga sp. S37H4]|uniref:Uncharacterized protein n=1 Tax=Marivirga aurantiaca TaxID=2802615 RepID=A0A935C542_9BACT|nr:hypothetical protein [Marivirga aurantiaca]MBK6263605.1 hypothetical protein [Marivirga aurantiaca]
MLKKITKPLIIGGVFYLVGFYSCLLIKKWTVLSVNNQVNIEINPLEILTLGITVMLAIYVTRTLSKKNDLEKNEKDLLINYLSEFKLLCNSKISKLLLNDNFDTPETKSDMKILRKKINSIIELAKEYKFIEENDTLATELNNKVRDIWELLTDCPEKVTSRASKTVKDGIERIRLEQVNKVEAALIDIERLIFKITMKINNK